MNAIHEFALLAVVAAPVVTIVSVNLILALCGERGTLLLPELGAFPTSGNVEALTQAPARIPAAVEAANDEMARQAA